MHNRSSLLLPAELSNPAASCEALPNATRRSRSHVSLARSILTGAVAAIALSGCGVFCGAAGGSGGGFGGGCATGMRF